MNPKHYTKSFEFPGMRIHLTIFSLLIFLVSCTVSREQAFTYNEGSIFGTYYHFKYFHPSGEDLHDEIQSLLKEFDSSLSTYNPESLISRVNSNDPEVEADDYLVSCFNKAQAIAADTGGAFDITVGPLVNAWGFGFSKREEITPELIETILEYTGYQKVKLSGNKIIKEFPEIQLDVNAIAKGMAVDVVAEFLLRNGCTDYMVEIGGEVVARGKNPKNVYWRIGINKPVDNPILDQQELQTVMELRDTAMATSGNYRNFYIKDGVKYAHSIDPFTGYPVQHSLLSATVLAPDCMTADAYATAFMVMGMDKAIPIVERHPEMKALFIFSDASGQHQVWESKRFGD